MWSLFLFISTTAYYTSDYMHRGQQEGERMERYVYDPKVIKHVWFRFPWGVVSDQSQDVVTAVF